MSVNRIVRSVRASDALDIIDSRKRATFFTLTTSDVCGCLDIRARWRKFRHRLFTRLKRAGIKPLYVMNYELHPGYLIKVVKDSRTNERVLHGSGHSHGWHIHGVINLRLRHDYCRDLLLSSGFGRSNFKPVTSHGVSDYLTKHALKAYSGLSRKERARYSKIRLRLVNTSRGLPSLDSYAWVSPLIESTRRLRNTWRARHEECGAKYPDYRLLHQRAEVCSLLGFSDSCQLYRLHEFLSSGCPVEKALSISAQKLSNLG